MWGSSNNVFGTDFGFSLFSIIPLLVIVGFVVVLGLIIFTVIKGAKQWNKNNHSPVLTVESTIVSKRADVSTHRRNSGDSSMNHTSSTTTYYITFQVESGDRMEFMIPHTEYGMLVEGDVGRLTFQGTRYLRFDRER